MDEAKRKGGRPRIEAGSTKRVVIAIRLSEQERLNINAAADRSSMPASDWIRLALKLAAKEALDLGR